MFNDVFSGLLNYRLNFAQVIIISKEQDVKNMKNYSLDTLDTTCFSPTWISWIQNLIRDSSMGHIK